MRCLYIFLFVSTCLFPDCSFLPCTSPIPPPDAFLDSPCLLQESHLSLKFVVAKFQVFSFFFFFIHTFCFSSCFFIQCSLCVTDSLFLPPESSRRICLSSSFLPGERLYVIVRFPNSNSWQASKQTKPRQKWTAESVDVKSYTQSLW